MNAAHAEKNGAAPIDWRKEGALRDVLGDEDEPRSLPLIAHEPVTETLSDETCPTSEIVDSNWKVVEVLSKGNPGYMASKIALGAHGCKHTGDLVHIYTSVTMVVVRDVCTDGVTTLATSNLGSGN